MDMLQSCLHLSAQQNLQVWLEPHISFLHLLQGLHISPTASALWIAAAVLWHTTLFQMASLTCRVALEGPPSSSKKAQSSRQHW